MVEVVEVVDVVVVVVVMGQGTGIWVQVTLPSDMHVLRDKDTSVNNPSFNSPYM